MFQSDRSQFISKNSQFKDFVLGHMALDIEVALKTKAGMPVKTGAMKSETRHFRNAQNGFRVEIDKAYASYQERGARADGSHIIRHNTTSGTSPHFFERGIDMVIRNKLHYITEAKKALNL